MLGKSFLKNAVGRVLWRIPIWRCQLSDRTGGLGLFLGPDFLFWSRAYAVLCKPLWLACQIAANPIRRRCTRCLAVITLAGKSGCEKNCISMQFQRIMEREIWWAGLFALVPAKDAPPPVSRFTHYETLLARALQMRESTKTSG